VRKVRRDLTAEGETSTRERFGSLDGTFAEHIADGRRHLLQGGLRLASGWGDSILVDRDEG